MLGYGQVQQQSKHLRVEIKIKNFFTDRLDTGHFNFATVCTDYASKLLLYAQLTLAIDFRMCSEASKLLLPACPYQRTKNKLFHDCYCMPIVRYQFAKVFALYTAIGYHMHSVR